MENCVSPFAMISGRTEASAALHARLAEVASELEKQTEVLNTLQRTRSSIQRQLNDLHDPMARLPLEISSEIFTYCLPSEEEEYPGLTDPLLFLQICTLWTQIALSTPGLWSNLSVEIPLDVTAEFERFLDGWILRAQDYQLSLSLTGSTVADPGIMGIVAAHAHHVHELEFESPSYLQLFSPGSIFPCLKILRVKWGGDSYRTPIAMNDIIQVLLSAPALTDCTLNLRNVLERPSTLGDCVHHADLNFWDIAASNADSSHVLQALTLPSLQHLGVSLRDGKDDELVSFFTRSRPPLESLELSTAGMQWARHTVERCFRPIPSMIELQLAGSDAFQDHLITILTDTSCDEFLPHLTDLTITRGAWGYPDAAWYKPLTAMLSWRCKKLEFFRLEWDQQVFQFPIPGPYPDDKRVLLALIADGMQIDLGPVMHTLYASD
jgi:hypothetical protein